MTDKKKVTMKDIANLAGVTTQTVSRALSDLDNVHPETKRKVLEIAKELNYIKNSSASILRSGSSKIIAVFYDNLRNLFFSLMSDFLYNSFKKYGYTIMTIPVFNSTLGLETYKEARSLNVAGIISFIETDDELSNYLKEFDFPFILFGRKSTYKNIGYIALDDIGGGIIAAKELLSIKGKNYLYIGETMNLGCSRDRYLGFKKELNKNNIQVELLDVQSSSIEEGLDKLKKDNKLPDSIFCFNDMLAFGAIKYYEMNNLKKPNIIGFDALSNDILLPCELKSIGVDKEYMANTACEYLISKIKGISNKDISMVLPVKIYE